MTHSVLGHTRILSPEKITSCGYCIHYFKNVHLPHITQYMFTYFLQLFLPRPLHICLPTIPIYDAFQQAMVALLLPFPKATYACSGAKSYEQSESLQHQARAPKLAQ